MKFPPGNIWRVFRRIFHVAVDLFPRRNNLMMQVTTRKAIRRPRNPGMADFGHLLAQDLRFVPALTELCGVAGHAEGRRAQSTNISTII